MYSKQTNTIEHSLERKNFTFVTLKETVEEMLLVGRKIHQSKYHD